MTVPDPSFSSAKTRIRLAGDLEAGQIKAAQKLEINCWDTACRGHMIHTFKANEHLSPAILESLREKMQSFPIVASRRIIGASGCVIFSRTKYIKDKTEKKVVYIRNQ